MKNYRDILNRIGIDGIAIAILGIIAIGVSIYDLLGGSNISQPVLVGVLGLFLLELILQRGRNERAKEEIIDSLNGVEIQVFESGKDFNDGKYRLLLESKDSLCDSEMCYARFVEQKEESSFRKLLNEKIRSGNFTYKVVQVIYDPKHFEILLERLFQFRNYDFYLGYFLSPPEVIPILNVMMFDRKKFILGGYYGPSARGEDRNIYLKHNLTSSTLEQYYEYLWSRARLFNEHKSINWDEIKYCAIKLGYTVEELNFAVERIAKKVGFTDFPKIE